MSESYNLYSSVKQQHLKGSVKPIITNAIEDSTAYLEIVTASIDKPNGLDHKKITIRENGQIYTTYASKDDSLV